MMICVLWDGWGWGCQGFVLQPPGSGVLGIKNMCGGSTVVNKCNRIILEHQIYRVYPMIYVPVYGLDNSIIVRYEPFCLYPSWLLHKHWDCHMIAPVPVKQPWRIWVNENKIQQHEQCNHMKVLASNWGSIWNKSNEYSVSYIFNIFRTTLN